MERTKQKYLTFMLVQSALQLLLINKFLIPIYFGSIFLNSDKKELLNFIFLCS